MSLVQCRPVSSEKRCHHHTCLFTFRFRLLSVAALLAAKTTYAIRKNESGLMLGLHLERIYGLSRSWGNSAESYEYCPARAAQDVPFPPLSSPGYHLSMGGQTSRSRRRWACQPGRALEAGPAGLSRASPWPTQGAAGNEAGRRCSASCRPIQVPDPCRGHRPPCT